MLHYQTVHPTTLELLQRLMRLPLLNAFNLAGGTALALHLGHRISVDLDFFTHQPFDSEQLFAQLQEDLSAPMEAIGRAENTLNLIIDDVKVDFLRHAYPLVQPMQTIDQLRLYTSADIAAMKLSAIANRGSRKDFYDVYFLLQSYPLQELMTFFTKKYGKGLEFMIYKSLLYFEDAEQEPEIMALQKVGWNTVKKVVGDAVKTML